MADWQCAAVRAAYGCQSPAAARCQATALLMSMPRQRASMAAGSSAASWNSAAVRAARGDMPIAASRLRSKSALVGCVHGRPGKIHGVLALSVPARSVDSLMIKVARVGARSIGVVPKVIRAPSGVV